MPSCCVKNCGARKSDNQPALTLHRFPVKEVLKKKWIKNIGIENINRRQKILFVCSTHFDESCFNRTLGVTRLRDGAVPSISLQPGRIRPRPTLELTLDLASTSNEMIPDKIGKSIVHDVKLPSVNLEKAPSTVQVRQQNDNKPINHCNKCDFLTRQVRSLKEKVRRRDGQIALFSNIIKDLQKKNALNSEKSLILEKCAVPQDFLKRQIKSEDLNVTNHRSSWVLIMSSVKFREDVET